MQFIIKFAQFHINFRIPELEAVAKIENINLSFDLASYDPLSPFLIVDIDNVEDAKKLVRRAILIKDIYWLWTSANDYEGIHANNKELKHLWEPYLVDKSWKFNVVSFGRSNPIEENISKINTFSYMPMAGPINLKTPDVEFAILEDYGFNPNDHIAPEDLKTVYFGVHIATGNRDLVKNYSLKSRKYIGNTSMDAELSLIMANMALCTSGKLVYDPFVGTGSFLVTSSHYGSYTMGSDIDGRQIRGRDGNSIKSNLDQYNMKGRMVDTLVFDVCNHPWRSTPLFDAICTDPPYGVRAGAKRLGRKRGNRTVEEIPLIDGVASHLRTDYRPPTVPYDMPEVLADLLEFAAKYLVVGGRIAYWLPNVVEEDEDPETPYHPNLELIADSEQPFNGWSRRLVVMEKKSEYDPNLPFDKPSNVDPKLIFRNRYFLPNQTKE